MKPGGRRWQSCRALSVSSDWQSTTSNSMSPFTSSPSTLPLLTLLLTPLLATSHNMADTAHAENKNTHTLKMYYLLQFTLSLVTKSNLRLGGNLILSVLRFVFVIWSRLATTKYHDLSITDLTCFYHLVSSHVLMYYRGFKQHTNDQLHFLYNQNKSCRNN